MAMDPNKEDENSRRAAYLSPPVVGGQATLVSHRPNEEMSRTTVREEQLRRFLQPNQNSQARYGLNFMNKVKERIYTTNEVEDEFGMSIRVEIHDLSDQSIVSAGDNFLSSAKVKLTVLNAELWEIKRETWRRSEFIQTVLREREGKGPILGGNPTIQLQNGVGTFENISFNDNSSWTRNGFRLGVIFEGDGEEGYFNGERVREGVSEPFRVLDRRGEAYQKPEKLDLTESIRRIRKIGDRRASLLENKEIFNVEDFLGWYYEKEDELLKILHITSKSNKGWKIMAKHVLLSANDYQAKKNSSQPQQALVDPNKSLSTNDGPPVVGLGSSEPNPHENDIIGGDMPVPPFNGQLPAIGYIPSMYLSNEPISFASGEHIGGTQPGFFPETNHANVESRNILNRDSVQPTNVGSDMAQYYEQLLAIGDIHSINFSNEPIPVASGEHIGETQADIFPETNHANVEFGNILNGVDSVEPTNVGGFTQPEVSIDSFLNGLLEDSPDYNMQYSWEGYGGSGGGDGGGGGGGGYVDTHFRQDNRKVRGYFRIDYRKSAGGGGGGGGGDDGGGGSRGGGGGGGRGGSGVQINGGRHGGRIENISPMSLIPRRSSSTSRFFRRTLSILVRMASRPRSLGFNRRSLITRRKVEVVVAEEVTVAVAGLEDLSLGEKPDVNS